MSFTLISKNGEKTFKDKNLVNISSKDGFDFKLDTDFEFMLTLQYDENTGKCTLLNQFNCDKFTFKGNIINEKLEIERVAKIMVKGADEFLTVKILDEPHLKTIAPDEVTETDIKNLYGNDINAAVKLKIDNRKVQIEEARIAITKEIAFKINDLKNKLSMNTKGGIALHIGLLLTSLICSFAVANYILGLPLKYADTVVQMPVNIKFMVMFTVIIYCLGLLMKQGFFLYLHNKTLDEVTVASKIAEKFMIIISSLFFVSVYFINVLYYMAPKSMVIFSVLISLFFVMLTVTFSISCGYFKFNGIHLNKELDKYEYREDFEHVVNEYQKWIERYANSFSHAKIKRLEDKSFMLQIASAWEILLGFITAPFLAYGVSNTLAMCFPEAAGWIRIMNLRFSPVFLVLATFMIIFAFFAFANAFTCVRKIQGSNVLKQDGFSDWTQHGVEIYGLAGVKRLNLDKARLFAIGISIIFIEFTMNISYFMTEIGGDVVGIIKSFLAALVPTALLLAETYMLSNTKFEISACSSLLSMIDKD